MGNLCSKFGKDRSINYVTLLSTDAGRTDGRTDVYVILYSVQCICIALVTIKRDITLTGLTDKLKLVISVVVLLYISYFVDCVSVKPRPAESF